MFTKQWFVSSYFRNDLKGYYLGKKKMKKFCPGGLNFFLALASDVAMAIRNAQLFKDLQTGREEAKPLFATIIAFWRN